MDDGLLTRHSRAGGNGNFILSFHRPGAFPPTAKTPLRSAFCARAAKKVMIHNCALFVGRFFWFGGAK
jgi:hypothetical protein